MLFCCCMIINYYVVLNYQQDLLLYKGKKHVIYVLSLDQVMKGIIIIPTVKININRNNIQWYITRKTWPQNV